MEVKYKKLKNNGKFSLEHKRKDIGEMSYQLYTS